MSTSTPGIQANLILRAPASKATVAAHDAALSTGGTPAPVKEAPHAEPAPAAAPTAKATPAIAAELVTLAQLHAVMPALPSAKAHLYIAPLNAAMAEFKINNRLRICAFLGQVAEESGQLAWFQEFASGWEYDISRNPTLARGLGNLTVGDGPRYKGRGPIQLTGRSNYVACGRALGIDLVDNPDLAIQPNIAFRTAGWFWSTHGLNALADQQDYRGITLRINGGYNGYATRLAFYERALTVFPAPPPHT
jgi:putative chitinase